MSDSHVTNLNHRGVGPPRRVLSREEIAEAIKCPHWQKVRLSLKGKSTEEKLKVLVSYRLVHQFGELACGVFNCDQNTMDIQVLNYLHALARGGQIKPLPWNFKFEDVQRLTHGPGHGILGWADWSYRLEIIR